MMYYAKPRISKLELKRILDLYAPIPKPKPKRLRVKKSTVDKVIREHNPIFNN